MKRHLKRLKKLVRRTAPRATLIAAAIASLARGPIIGRGVGGGAREHTGVSWGRTSSLRNRSLEPQNVTSARSVGATIYNILPAAAASYIDVLRSAKDLVILKQGDVVGRKPLYKLLSPRGPAGMWQKSNRSANIYEAPAWSSRFSSFLQTRRSSAHPLRSRSYSA